MKRYFVSVLGLALSSSVFASFPKEHQHITPDNFSMSCDSQWVGGKKLEFRNDISWSKLNTEMRISGQSIMNDTKVFNNENTDIQNLKVTSVVSIWDGFGDRLPSKTLYMTFAIEQFFLKDHYHGKAPFELTTFKFTVNKDGSGHFLMNSAQAVDGILVFKTGDELVLADCKASFDMYSRL